MGDNNTHTKYSMSSAHRWHKCSGSIFMALAYPQKRQSKYAAEGTLAHEISEKILLESLSNGTSIKHAWEMFKDKCKDEEMQEYTLGYAQTVKELLPLKAELVAIERKFALSEDPELGGTADVAFVALNASSERCGVIVDLKYGAGHAVEVEGNLQLMGYAAAMHKTEGWGPLDRAVVYIYQPRAEHPDGALRSVKLDREALDYWAEDLVRRAREIDAELEAGEQKFIPGEHCRWCSGEAVCSANNKQLVVAAELDFTKPVTVELPDPWELAPKQLANIVQYRSVIESHFKRVTEWVENEMRAGAKYKDLKLVRGRANRKWLKDTDKVAEGLIKLGVKEPFKERELKGLGVIEKEVGTGKINDLVEKPDAPLKVAHVSDKRPAAVVKETDAEIDFCF